jgi:hypothetical protein
MLLLVDEACAAVTAAETPFFSVSKVVLPNMLNFLVMSLI